MEQVSEISYYVRLADIGGSQDIEGYTNDKYNRVEVLFNCLMTEVLILGISAGVIIGPSIFIGTCVIIDAK